MGSRGALEDVPVRDPRGPYMWLILPAILLAGGFWYVALTADWTSQGRYILFETPPSSTVTVDGVLLGAKERQQHPGNNNLVHSVLLDYGEHSVNVATATVEISDTFIVPEKRKSTLQWVVVGQYDDDLWLEVQWREPTFRRGGRRGGR